MNFTQGQIKITFFELLSRYTNDSRLIAQLWAEIERNYTKQNRYYHTLAHLSNLIEQLDEVQSEIAHWDTVLFSVFYHDIVYDTLRKDNEEKSAQLAATRLKQVSVPADIISICEAQILATKVHASSANPDTNFLTDADLAVLGSPWSAYTAYFKNIRKEYSFYPALVYKPGRKKVLTHFLTMNRIFKTDFFFNKFELQARQNLKQELDLL